MIFNYHLSSDRIAQRPVSPPEAAKLLVVDRRTGKITDTTFLSVAEFLSAEDLMIFNNTKVMPSRLFGQLPGGGQCELLLTKEIDESNWHALGRPLKKLKRDTVVAFSGSLRAKVLERFDDNTIAVKFTSDQPQSLRSQILSQGLMPIPPYIRAGRSDDRDREDYQSIFAAVEGSIAAPTASLHFNDKNIRLIKEKGIIIKEVTLHVGTPSFLPIASEEEPENFIRPGKEEYEHSPEICKLIAETKSKASRVIAVGTTVVRAVESMMKMKNAQDGNFYKTDLFIEPGFNWQAVNVLITNFHQPRTTHLLLVESFLGRDLLEKCYNHALANNYRFLSYGDGMMIL